MGTSGTPGSVASRSGSAPSCTARGPGVGGAAAGAVAASTTRLAGLASGTAGIWTVSLGSVMALPAPLRLGLRLRRPPLRRGLGPRLGRGGEGPVEVLGLGAHGGEVRVGVERRDERRGQRVAAPDA